MKDLIIQGPTLSPEALDTFKVAAMPERIRVNGKSARCTGVADDAATVKAVRGLAEYWKLDWAMVDPDMQLADYCLTAFDMDSTLVTIETLDEVAACAGRGEAVAAITEAAMRGEIRDYSESLRRRVALLAGTDAALLEKVYKTRLEVSEGAEKLLTRCKAAGHKTLLATGGFTFFTERIGKRFGFDFVRSNELEIVDGKLSGNVSGPDSGPIVDAAGKAQALREACASIGCATARAIAIGDGANDLAMMKLAGISVAYRAKPVVREQASFALDYSALDGVLNWFADT
jgi:phosphoserine phosphatase